MFRPLISNYTRDTGFCSFGVYARKSFRKGDFIPGLVGFLAPIKENEIIDGKNDVSVIRHHTGSKVMLGGVSFVNSSCRENAAYVANTKQAQVRLRVTSSAGISPGDEITVLYSGDYFGPERKFCECPHTEMHGKSHSMQSWTRSGRIRALRFSKSRLAKEEFEKKALQKLRKRHRDIGLTYQSRVTKRSRYRVRLLSCSDSSASRASSSDTSDNDIPHESSSNFEDFIEEVAVNPCSTPVKIDCLSDNDGEEPHVSTHSPNANNDESQQSEFYDGSSSAAEMIGTGSKFSTQSFCGEIMDLADTHALSERDVAGILCLSSKAMPSANNLPTMYSLRQQENSLLSGIVERKILEGIIFDLNFERQLSHVLSENYDLITAENFQLQTHLSLPKPDKNCLFFALSTDGVSPFNSAKCNLYPVWLMLLNLPSKRSVSYKNLLLLSLFGGDRKPKVDDLMNHTVKNFVNFNAVRRLNVKGSTIEFTAKIQYVIVDMLMKAPLMNQTQFNGRYGCSNCLAIGRRALKKDVWIYPFNEENVSERTSKDRMVVLRCLKPGQKSLFGLRGKQKVKIFKVNIWYFSLT